MHKKFKTSSKSQTKTKKRSCNDQIQFKQVAKDIYKDKWIMTKNAKIQKMILKQITTS